MNVSSTGLRATFKPTDAMRERVQEVCRMIADGTRLEVLLSLAREPELHVNALCQRLRQSQPAVSHHLALLKKAGILEMRREGRHNFYSIRRPYLNLLRDLLQALEAKPVADAELVAH